MLLGLFHRHSTTPEAASAASGDLDVYSGLPRHAQEVLKIRVRYIRYSMVINLGVMLHNLHRLFDPSAYKPATIFLVLLIGITLYTQGLIIHRIKKHDYVDDGYAPGTKKRINV